MICSRCQRDVPDESTFCLSCGTRLVPADRLVSPNGRGGAAAGASGRERVTSAVPAAPREGAPGRSGREAYALSFKPIADERVRYRVARWVCERAPAHALPEVQEALGLGDFVTFLALTAEEAEAARQGIQALGVAPALVSLAPAATAPTLILEPRARVGSKGGAGRAVTRTDWVTVLGVLTALFVFGLVLMRLFGGRGF